MVKTRKVNTDVLVVGGGSAGCMAAVKAKDADPSLDVTVMEKGALTSSGAIAMGMDALNIVAVPGISTPEEYVETMTQTCEGILDQRLCYVMARESFAVLKELERWGVRFPRDEAGQYQVLQVHSKGRFLVPMDAPDLKRILAREVRIRGISIIERTMATRLLTVGNAVAGAIGLNVRTGDFVVCRAKATILATGPAGRFGLPSTGYLYGTYEFPGNAGDGYSMAYRAGAELTGFEYTHPALRVKDFNGPIWYITLPRGGQMVNAVGDVLSGGVAEGGYPGVPIMRAWREIQAGRGPIYLKLSHLPEERIAEIEDVLFSTERPTLKRFLEGRGIDLRRDLVEMEFTEPGLCGGHGITGLVVDEEGQTSLERLYAAGDVAAVPLQHLTGALVFGSIAGERAAEAAASSEAPSISKDQVEEEERRVFKPISRVGGVEASALEFKIRRTINEYIASPKTGIKLKIALTKIERLRGDLERLYARDPHELGRALEIRCILDCAEMAVKASLMREESRWGMAHYRLDFPDRDDRRWMKHIIIKQDSETGEALLYSRPVKLEWRF